MKEDKIYQCHCGLAVRTKVEEYLCPKCNTHIISPDRCNDSGCQAKKRMYKELA
jgi:predicted RNA-binding Zn-ribbon protein involved in translation (DUF1610 family)